jgi:hypothetical protein
MRLVLLAPILSALALSGGCFNWQSTYDSAARRDCSAVVNAEDRQECLTWVERNSAERRADERS